MREKVEDQKQILVEGNKSKQAQPPPPPPSSSSPSHEFSFTISLHPPPPIHNSLTLDLSPADDIFYHGHLLPLHLLSHLPVSPRSSANSLDSFTLPITELLHDPQNPNTTTTTTTTSRNNHQTKDSQIKGRTKSKSKSKSKSLSLFGLSKWRKGCEEEEDRERHEKKKKKVSDVVKRYMRLVRPMLMRLGGRRRRSNRDLFSGNLSTMRDDKEEVRGRWRGEFSAPASMSTSPTNSGLLVPTPTNDSTMEELQAAIQAAIAHCKNSIAMEEKIKSQDYVSS